MTLINILNKYTNSDTYCTNAGNILSNIHKAYSSHELRFVLSIPKYKAIYDKIRYDAFANKCISTMPRNTNKFKLGLSKIYDECPVTGTTSKLCEFAHIVPYSMCESYEQDDPNNGIRIDIRIHKLWDSSDNWLELHPLNELAGTVVFKLPERHSNNPIVYKTVSQFIDKPIYNINNETFGYIKRRLIIDNI
jgi:hypothetical protein